MKILTFSVGAMRTNCYLLVDEATKLTAVVDPGDECGRILEALESRELKAEFILLTHGHFDHLMALDCIRKHTGAPAYIHTDDSRAITDPSVSFMKQFTGIDIPSPPAERLLADSEIIHLGKSAIRVMHTPGHSPGSVCYFCEDNIITGDTLMRNSIGRYDLDGGDYEQLLASLKKLSSIDGEYKLYPGHGSSSTLSYEKQNNIFLQ